MAEWCAEHLRNCEGWKSASLELSTTSNENAKWLDACIRQLVSWTDCVSLGGFHASIEHLIQSDPNAIMARSFLLGLSGLGTKVTSRDTEFAAKLDQLEIDAQSFGNEREKKHSKAAVLWGRGKHHEAAEIWDRILDDYPNDLLAVKFAHDAHFFNGNSIGKRHSVEKVIKHWRTDEPCYSYLHGMYAFGLEECGLYGDAEVEADKALMLNRFDCWATHAKSHVLEMNGRSKEGREFMYGTEDEWKKGWMIASHNYWHTALFHIEVEEYETALEIFDKEVIERFAKSGSLLDMDDASSLLWRLELEGVEVGSERWKRIDHLEKYSNNHSVVFNDIHAGMAFYRQAEHTLEQELRSSLEDYAFRRASKEDNAQISETVGIPLYDGMISYAKKEYDVAVEKMYPIRDKVIQIGGSHAQRDVFVQTLLNSCIWSERAENWKRTPELLVERAVMKHDSLLAKRLEEKFKKLHPDSVLCKL